MEQLQIPVYNPVEDAVKVERAKSEADLKTVRIGPNPNILAEKLLFQNPTRESLQKQLEVRRKTIKEAEEADDHIKLYTQKRFIALIYTSASINNIDMEC
ncbi:MAG: hypothetical protein SAK29_42825 [Scytonema sp. PMC 1069.18]|nr:hypothetical protein [Scytonema sp. PMC 1069.18]MEC4882578.1 hypothetical protein [Scytonema sp. PMC 1070.18]